MSGIRARGFVFGGAVVAMLGIASLGCNRLHAKTPTATPSLAIPEPPARLVIPVSIEAPAAPPASTTDKPVPTPTPRPAPARPTPPATPPPATTTPPPVETPPPVLQTATSLAELEARARERLGRAEKDLARVSRGALGPDARDQYDSAARFIRIAKEAITAKNFVYAAYCADKAATLASLLVKFELRSSNSEVRSTSS